MGKFKIKKDKFKKARGGQSKIIEILCANCKNHICFYQKDGPGILKRMYLDRIIDHNIENKNLECENCDKILGVKMVYEKESRLAYRLFIGAVSKRLTKN